MHGVRTLATTYAQNLKDPKENLENRTFWVKKENLSSFNQDIWKYIAHLTRNYTSYSIE